MVEKLNLSVFFPVVGAPKTIYARQIARIGLNSRRYPIVSYPKCPKNNLREK
jgi:hypothetical protein